MTFRTLRQGHSKDQQKRESILYSPILAEIETEKGRKRIPLSSQAI